jgi:hypothetical protein
MKEIITVPKPHAPSPPANSIDQYGVNIHVGEFCVEANVPPAASVRCCPSQQDKPAIFLCIVGAGNQYKF